MNTRHWLISAFEPFLGRESNNSNAVLREMLHSGTTLTLHSGDAIQFHSLILPVEYDRCFEVLHEEVLKLQTSGIQLEGVLSLGEGAEEFKIETQANNCDDVPDFADNRGVIRVGEPIFEDLALEDPLPLRFPLEAFSRIRTSMNPGFFVCNHLCARMSREYSKKESPRHFGFIHVPKTGSGGMFTPDVCAAVILNGFRKL